MRWHKEGQLMPMLDSHSLPFLPTPQEAWLSMAEGCLEFAHPLLLKRDGSLLTFDASFCREQIQSRIY